MMYELQPSASQMPLTPRAFVSRTLPIRPPATGADTVAFGRTAPLPNADHVIPLLRQSGKTTQVIKFGALNDPLAKQPPALQMKVRGVTRHQGKLGEAVGPIGKLAASNWKDGQRLSFTLAQKRIQLSAPGFGPIGMVPPEIADRIYPILAANPKAFHFELSNMIAGTTQGASTIGLRVNLLYDGNDPQEDAAARKAFTGVLNDPRCKDSAMLYQPATSPEEVLRLILQHERKTHGAQAARQMSTVIDTIAAKIKDPSNKRILLLGHCKPDGDTLGCVVGMQNIIKLMDPTRQVDTAVDDRIPGLFRNKVPGVNDIKHPDNPDKLLQIRQLITEIEDKLRHPSGKPQDQPELLKGRLAGLRHEERILSDAKNLLNPQDEYDLVITMDIPTPTRFTDKFKPYLDKAKDVIFIDHHPARFNEWDAAKDSTGLDIESIRQKNLAWVAEAVGACAQMMTVIGDRLVPQLNQVAQGTPVRQAFPQSAQQQQLARYVAGLVTGMCTDTGSYTRTASLTPDDMNKPVEARPNFQPEGVAKWLMNLTQQLKGDRIDKKWLRENITYGISDKAHALAMAFAKAGTVERPEIGYGAIEVDYDQMNAVWQTALEDDGAVTLLDIQNEFKYSDIMGRLKGDPRAQRRGEAPGPYANDGVAVLICQDKQQGELDEKLQIASDNSLRLSIRSSNGTNHAETIASLFGGGGHGAAAGGRVDLPGVTLKTPLGIQLNGQLTQDLSAVLQALQHNLKVLHNPRLSDAEKQRQSIPVGVVADPSGKPCAALIADVVATLRQTQGRGGGSNPNEKPARGRGHGGRVTSFPQPTPPATDASGRPQPKFPPMRRRG